MAHIQLPEGLPGIRGAMAFRPETAKPRNELAEILLHGPSSLTPGERELIATYTSPARMTVSFARPAMALPRRLT
jgi:alkylhydroperoxidase family enzyme